MNARDIKDKLKRIPKWGWIALAAGGGLVLLGGNATVQAEAFKAALYALYGGSAADLSDVILRVAREKGVSPLLIASILHNESAFGDALSPRGPGGTGDAGHGHGLMQIDDRTWGDWLSQYDWTDPYTNVLKGVDIYLAGRKALSGTNRISDQIPGDGTVTLTSSAASKRGVSSGQYADPRPLSGDDLDRASLAAYNTGVANVIESLAVGLPAETTTANGNYTTDAYATFDKLYSIIGTV